MPRPQVEEINVFRLLTEIQRQFGGTQIGGNKVKEILTDAAQIIVTSAKMSAPIADRDVKVYNTARISRRYRTPKGMGTVKKIIRRGNLRNQIKILKHGKFRRANYSVFIGPKYPQASYAHIVSFGSRFVRTRNNFMKRAFEQNRSRVTAFIASRIRQELLRIINQPSP